jgi:hypothetical protein
MRRPAEARSIRSRAFCCIKVIGIESEARCDEQKQGIQEELHGASSASTV